MTPALTINGVDLSALGVTLHSASALPLGGEATQLVEIPGRYGAVRTGGHATAGEKTYEGNWLAEDLAAGEDVAHASAVARRDALVAALRGECVIRQPDFPDREWVGWLQAQGSTAKFLDPEWVAKGGALTLRFALPDPTARARTTTVAAGTPASLALGTATSPLTVEVTPSAPATRVVVTVLGAGTPLRVFGWTGGVPAGVTWTLDAESRSLLVGGAPAFGGREPGYRFPLAEPGADQVQVAVTGGGSCAVSVSYRKRWW